MNQQGKQAMKPGSTIIAPSILAADFSKLGDEIRSVEAAGADWLHIDVMDGTFVPPITFGANMVSLAKSVSKLFLDVHLMIVNPELHIQSFKEAGANRLIIHQECSPHLHRVLGEIKKSGMSSGACVNPGTPVSTLYDALEVCDLVLIMTVNPGWGGQPFLPSCLKKIEQLKSEIVKRNLCVHIQVDGGINPETARQCRDAGADVMVAGSSVFGAKDRAALIKALR